MMIVITEDDAQNGVDHIDAHRSILMVISPWAKKNYVSHYHYSFGSIYKTFWNILGYNYNANTVLWQEEKLLLQSGDCPE